MRKQNLPSWIYFLGVFIFFVVWYTTIHPLIPYNSDDWMFMSANRIALPSIHAWNPSRVLPETLMPLFSGLAAYTVYPLTGDYIGAQCLVHSLVMASCITLYLFVFVRLLTKRFGVERSASLLIGGFFLLLHFLVFRTGDTGNVHLFYSDDLTCHYFYLVPNLLCAILVMSLIHHDWMEENSWTSLKKGLAVLVVYLAICSNLYCSDILVCFLGCRILLAFFHKGDKGLLNFMRKQWLPLCIIGFWLVVNVMELLGPRSAYLAQEAQGASLTSQFVAAVLAFVGLRYNLLFVAIVLAGGVYGVWRTVREHKMSQSVLQLLMTAAVTFLYVLIVSTKVKPAYMQRADILFAVFFPILLLVTLSVVDAARRFKVVMMGLPLLMLIMFSQMNRSQTSFRDLRINSSVDGNYTIETLRRVDNYMIDQMVKADKNNTADSVFVKVPLVTEDEKNWPYLLIYNNCYNMLHQVLLKHGVIEHTHPGKLVVEKPLSQY